MYKNKINALRVQDDSRLLDMEGEEDKPPVLQRM